MQSWIREHGDSFGWQKTEAMSESWHFNFVGGVDFPSFEEMKKGSHGKRVERLTKRLAFIHEPGGKAFLAEPSEKFTEAVEEAVSRFQKTYKLEVDGIAKASGLLVFTQLGDAVYTAREGGSLLAFDVLATLVLAVDAVGLGLFRHTGAWARRLFGLFGGGVVFRAVAGRRGRPDSGRNRCQNHSGKRCGDLGLKLHICLLFGPPVRASFVVLQLREREVVWPVRA